MLARNYITKFSIKAKRGEIDILSDSLQELLLLSEYRTNEIYSYMNLPDKGRTVRTHCAFTKPFQDTILYIYI